MLMGYTVDGTYDAGQPIAAFVLLFFSFALQILQEKLVTIGIT
jgi:hypothetical protein